MRHSLFAVLLFLSAGLHAQAPTPVGDQFQINTYTFGHQDRPDAAVDSAGNFVVVWSSNGSSGTDTSGRSIQMQRYDANGNKLGGEFQVNTYTTYQQEQPSVSMDAAGNFVVVWTGNGSSGTDTSDDSVHGRLFDSSGNPVGDEFQVNTYTTDDQKEAVVAMNPAGEFVVVWESYGSNDTDSDNSSIQGQLYDADGDPIGGEFQVNTYTTSDQDYAAITADGQGNFIVVWKSQNKFIKGQIYDATGAAVGGEFQVQTDGNGAQPAVAADSLGNFAVAWRAEGATGTDTDETSIQAQRYDTGGNPVGDQFQVNTYTTYWQEDPGIAMDSDGNFVIAWESPGPPLGSTPDRIQAQYYDSSGAPIGDEFQVNSDPSTFNQNNPSPAMRSPGEFIVVWDALGSPGNDSNARSSQGQRFGTADIIFGDGFESGDTTAWNSTVQ